MCSVYKVHVVQINDIRLLRFVRPLHFRKLIVILIRFVKGIVRHSQRYFFHPNVTMGRSEVKKKTPMISTVLPL